MNKRQSVIVDGKYFDSMYKAVKELHIAMKTIRKRCLSEFYSDYYYTEYKIPEKKTCLYCGEEKYINEFYKKNGGRDGYRSECKECTYEKTKKYRKANPEQFKGTWLKRTYGITKEEYNEMFENQEGKCKICGVHQSELDRPLFVDHDHETDEVRGLLCLKCNSGMGLLNDNIELLLKAINYLKN